jgi:hypothetical protein
MRFPKAKRAKSSVKITGKATWAAETAGDVWLDNLLRTAIGLTLPANEAKVNKQSYWILYIQQQHTTCSGPCVEIGARIAFCFQPWW